MQVGRWTHCQRPTYVTASAAPGTWTLKRPRMFQHYQMTLTIDVAALGLLVNVFSHLVRFFLKSSQALGAPGTATSAIRAGSGQWPRTMQPDSAMAFHAARISAAV